MKPRVIMESLITDEDAYLSICVPIRNMDYERKVTLERNCRATSLTSPEDTWLSDREPFSV